MSPTPSVATRVRKSGFAAMRSVARTFALDRGIDAWLQEIEPAWSLGSLRARVVGVVTETHDTKTFVLEPNGHWPGHLAGQFVPVEVDVGGVRTVRCYSLSSSPSEPRLRLTVKRVPSGRVSGFLHDHVRYGDVLRLGAPAGDFVLPTPRPAKLLLVSGGSGVTPIMSILRSLVASENVGDVVFVHAARSASDVLFRSELEELALRFPELRLMFFLDDAESGRLDPTKLRQAVPDLAERHTMLCGPQGMMDGLAPIWAETGLGSRLQMERFALPARAVRAEGAEGAEGATPTKVRVTLLRSGRTATTEGEGTLLEALEQAGETPAHGCRMGICNTCLCRKKSGVVTNVATGAVSSEPDEDIRLCTSRAESDLELVL